MNQSSQKSLEALASPSNLAMATLVGFLFVGQSTDWKMLRGRSSKPATSLQSVHSTRAYPRLRPGASPVYLKVEGQSEVVDRRIVPREGVSRPALD